MFRGKSSGRVQDYCTRKFSSSDIILYKVDSLLLANLYMYMYIHCIYSHVSYIPTQTTTATAELCVYGFGGTSATCPMMSGAIALALEAKLDIRIICVCNVMTLVLIYMLY